MADSDQLRFNVHVAPDPSRMATSFKLRPGPVIIEQLPRQLETKHHFESFPARMELASRLARRELEYKMLQGASSDHNQRATEGPPPFLAAAHRHPQQQPPPQSQPRPPPVSHSVRFTEPPKHSTFGATSRTATQLCPATSGSGEGGEKDGDRREVDHTAAEIVRLRRELTKQVKRLQQLTQDSNGM